MPEEGLNYILEAGKILARELRLDELEKSLLEFREKFTRSLLEVDTALWLILMNKYFSLIRKLLRVIADIMSTYPQYSYEYAKLYLHSLVGAVIASKKCMLVKVRREVSRSEFGVNKLKCLPTDDAIQLALLGYVEPLTLVNEIELKD